MSNSLLKITQLNFYGEGAWPDLNIENVSPNLNVFYGPPRSGKSSVAQLVGHLLYGQTESSWRRQFGQTVSTAAGTVQFEGTQGDFVLRRQRDQHRNSRLTISSANGDQVDSQTIQDLLAGLSPQQAETLYAVDFAESPRADWLLTETFVRELSSASPANSPRYTDRQPICCNLSSNSPEERIDRQRIEQLVQRRDALTSEVEQQLAVRRRESEVLQRELSEVDTALNSKREYAKQLRTDLHRIDADIAELETRLRYYSLEYTTKHISHSPDEEQQRRAISELDSEISHCRQTLNEIVQREGLLRTELAQCNPDGTADSVTYLADGRATLGVLEQLVDDLDAEVSQLARASEAGRCIGHDAHAKISPVTALLRQQVYTLCGQITEQERAERRRQLSAEMRQLARVQTELGERLELLLSRRESLIQGYQRIGQSARLVPQPPATEHCRCEHHGEFVQSADRVLLGSIDREQHEASARQELSALQLKRNRLVDELHTLEADLKQLEASWEKLQHERAGLIGGTSLEELQTELERLESVIRQSLEAGESVSNTAAQSVWRASDILAQLTDGLFVQIRLQRSPVQATLVDRSGNLRTFDSLSPAEHDQLYLALTLSLVSSYAQRGIHLPLILDEPFLQQDAAQSAIMAGVLDEFARAGHQLFVFTEDREVWRRFSTLNVRRFDIEALRRTKAEKTVYAPVAEPMPVVQTTNTRIIRETHDDHGTPVLRLATVDGDMQQDDVFLLTENSTFSDFPVLGADTSRIFSRIGINSIGELLIAEAFQIAEQLARQEITSDTVRLWQIHTGLMCFVPNLTLNDAQVLAACNINSPDALCEAALDELWQLVQEFISSERGHRFQRSNGRYRRERLKNWRSGARRYRDRWQRASRRYSNWYSRSPRSSRTSRTTEKRPKPVQTNDRPRRFYLSREQDVEAAPSIGPKTAARLAKVGIRTVADLLNANPESTAQELDVSHISANAIADWQHQARLVCQIPNMRGYGAQLLVACGLTQPEQIADCDGQELAELILQFCETKEGQRILRSGEPPASEKIAKWASLAKHSRPLEAA